MVDRLYSHPRLAALYDAFHAGGADLEFYLPLMLAADSVLDVGCGTGVFLHAARDAGHAGRLCGLDPAEEMLRHARRRSDIEWVLGDLRSAPWSREFALVVMTGHAFQVWLEDAEIRASLAAIHAALADGGRFAFETRNPAARPWEAWTPDRVFEAVDERGDRVRLAHRVDAVDGDIVSFTTTYTSPAWAKPEESRSRLRFLAPPLLDRFLGETGFRIEARFGNWDRSPLTARSPEIITIARAVA